MSIEDIHSMLGWCTLINLGLLLVWFLFFWFGHDWMYRFHRERFKLSIDTFDAIQYGGMGLFKILIFVFNLVPYVALLVIR